MSSLNLGKILLNQYRVEEFITSTPLGELYRVTDERTNKSFALTLLPKEISDDLEAIKEIESKSRTLQNINHPNLAKYLGLYQTPTLAFLLEEWIDGPSLNDIFKQDILLNAEEVITYTKSLCNALEALHKQNFLHLNLAPELIRINQKGEVKLSGIANATPLNQKASRKLSKHTPLYISPEELKEQNPSPASDVYSLSILLYQLITNKWINGKQLPKSIEAIRKTHLETNPPAPISFNKNIPDNFSRMLLWALRKNPDDRLKNTTELLSSLALSVQISIDKIPLHASGIHAPVTSTVLHSWKFLPPPKASTDTIPLEDRLANISSPIPKKKSNVRVMPIFFLLLFAGIFALFFFIRPVEPAVSTLPTITPFVPNITPPPTFTLEPRPTKEFGGQITFTCTRGDYNQVCIVNRDGSGYTQITDMEASNYYPVFTPDGSSLLFASNRNGPFDFFLLIFSQREIIPITNNVGNVISPDYSPDGRQIVFANKVGDNPTAIWMVNADGLNPRLIYTGARDIVAVAWSPNGEKIAYAMSMGVPQEYEIYTMDVNGRNHLTVSQGLLGVGGSVDWSLDSRSLLIHAGAFGNKDIFRIDAETGDFTQLTNGGNNASASYSPDGNYIVFNSLRNDDQADLYIMRADGTNEVQLTNHPEPDWGARWID